MSGITTIKPAHPAIKAYHEALKQFSQYGAHHEGATETAFSRLLADTANSAAAWVLPIVDFICASVAEVA